MAPALVFEVSDRYRWPLGWIVQARTCAWAVHVAIQVPGGWLAAAPDGGVAIRPDAPTPRRREIWAVETPRAETAIRWAVGQLGKPYDWSGDLGFGLRLGALQDQDAWFCSELAQATALWAGVDLAGTSPKWTSPAGLLKGLRRLGRRVEEPEGRPAARK